jgi:hypothetical protein
MICRLWHGWTTRANPDAYERLLRTEIFRGIESGSIPGYRGLELLRRDIGDASDPSAEVEFATLMVFDSLDAVRAFAGDEYELAVVPPAARALLRRFDERSTHDEVRRTSSLGL